MKLSDVPGVVMAKPDRQLVLWPYPNDYCRGVPVRRLLIFVSLFFALTFAASGTAGAQTLCGSVTPCTPPVDVGGEEIINDDVDDEDVEVAGDVTTRRPAVSGQLPVTGGDLIGLTVVGLSAVAVGGALVTQRRRTTD